MHTHPPGPPSPARPPGEHTSPDLTASVWQAMSAFVFGNDPTDELRETLGLGRGTGRIKALINLTDGPLGPAELAKRIGVDPPYATIIVNELRAHGLLSRSADDRDRRRKSVELTPEGRAAAQKAQAIIARPPMALRAMPADDLARLSELLDTLLPRE